MKSRLRKSKNIQHGTDFNLRGLTGFKENLYIIHKLIYVQTRCF